MEREEHPSPDEELQDEQEEGRGAPPADDPLDEEPDYNPDDEGLKGIKGG